MLSSVCNSRPAAGLFCLCLAAGCGQSRVADRHVFDDFEDENVTVIGDDATKDEPVGEERITVSGPAGEGECVEVSDSLCVPADTQNSTWCERDGGPADIVVVDGEVVEVICYPPAAVDGTATAGTPEQPVEIIATTDAGNIEVVQNANRTAVVFDDATNGIPIEGDLNVAGNQVSVYGNGPDETIIKGDVTIEGNNVRLRGVTIDGDLTITLNTAAVVLCRILGNVTLAKNNSVFVENDVLGNLTVPESNNITLTGNDVQGEWDVQGHGHVCDGNHAFTDTNENNVADAEERGELLGCPAVP